MEIHQKASAPDALQSEVVFLIGPKNTQPNLRVSVE